MVAGRRYREVAVRGSHRLVCDGWAYYDQPRSTRRLTSFVGYFETDQEAIQKWLDMLGESR